MATPGEVIVNRVTGERVEFLATATTTAGERLRFAFTVRPRGYLPVKHLHPTQDETFVVDRGELQVAIGAGTRALARGQSLTIRRGQPHQWWNKTDAEVSLEVEFRPAGRTEEFLEQYFGLCNLGRSRPDGTPPFLQIMAWANEYELYVAGPPVGLQRVMGAVLGRFARLLGYRAYDPALSAAAIESVAVK